jgi:hypothetical protein
MASQMNATEFINQLSNHKQLIWSDGTLTYTINIDHSIQANPDASGRTISGKWYLDEYDHIVVIGKWEWINGKYIDNDFRKMIIDVRIIGAVNDQNKTFKSYHVIEHLNKLTSDEYKSELTKCVTK